MMLPHESPTIPSAGGSLLGRSGVWGEGAWAPDKVAGCGELYREHEAHASGRGVPVLLAPGKSQGGGLGVVLACGWAANHSRDNRAQPEGDLHGRDGQPLFRWLATPFRCSWAGGLRAAAACLLLVAGSLGAGCATGGASRGGVATIGKAILSPFKAIGTGVASLPAKGGNGSQKAQEAAGDGSLASITQPDAPGQQSSQNYETTTEEGMTFSEVTRITESVNQPNGGFLTRTIHVPAGSTKTTKQTHKVGQVIGAAQAPDKTASILGSFKWVQGLGVLTLLIGAVGFAHPAARLLIGGKDTAVVISLVGVGMIAGPFLLVQYADWFALGILAAALYWFWSRSKHKEGVLAALTETPKEKDATP